MKIVVKNSASMVAAFVHDLVVAQLSVNPRSVLALPTGTTPVPIYARLVDSYRSGAHSWREATTFNLDEYLGLGADDPNSYAAYMRRELFDHVDCPSNQINIPDGISLNPNEEAQRYETAIAAAGGIDLALLGIGTNGHIGFNEPGSGFDSRTRVVELSESTLRANAVHFLERSAMPTSAISMGIKTILGSRRIVVVATGAEKSDAVAKSVSGPPTQDIPGSALQRSGDVTFVLDEAAAKGLRRLSTNMRSTALHHSHG